MNSRTFADRETLDRTLASDVAAILARAIAGRGHATLVVSGGSTPAGFFRELSRKSLPWAQVSVLLADERWVAPDDPASNERLVRQNLLVDAASAARFIPLRTADENPEDAEALLDQRLSELGTFDLVMLGMGNDGHTASLFPGATALDAALDRHSGRQCIAVTPPHAPHRRISLTLPRLLDSRQIFLHITGDDKRQVLEQAVRKNALAQFPVAALVNQSETPVTLYFSD